LRLEGYRGPSKKLLEEHGLEVGDYIVVETTDGVQLEGVLMSRYEYADEEHITLKLRNGYNIGVNVSKIKRISFISKGPAPAFIRPELPTIPSYLSRAVILGTGGTIASRVDYRTGGVRPALQAEDLYSLIPELATRAEIYSESLFSIYSENMTPEHWKRMAIRIGELVESGFEGVVVTHGTDTMGYTAAALSFALADVPIPVTLAGSQRSSDRPSSDATLNLLGALDVSLKAPFRGVYVVMHHTISDDYLAVHLGTRVRKNHTSRRDAFQSINTTPVALVKDRKIEVLQKNLPERRPPGKFEVRPEFREKVGLIKFHPNLNQEIFDFLMEKGYEGVVIEGTGLGHVSSVLIPKLKEMVDHGMLVGITSQCIWGRVRLFVYETGRDMLRAGVLPLEDMLPETAFVKMMWALANSEGLEDAAKLMLTNIAGEISAKHEVRGTGLL